MRSLIAVFCLFLPGLTAFANSQVITDDNVELIEYIVEESQNDSFHSCTLEVTLLKTIEFGPNERSLFATKDGVVAQTAYGRNKTPAPETEQFCLMFFRNSEAEMSERARSSIKHYNEGEKLLITNIADVTGDSFVAPIIGMKHAVLAVGDDFALRCFKPSGGKSITLGDVKSSLEKIASVSMSCPVR